jgi:PAS domain S-box-containing protein
MNTPFDVAQLALLGEAVECTQDAAVFVWDEDRNYVAVNQAACRLLGKTRDELLGMRVGDMAENRAQPLFDEVQRAGIHTGQITFDSTTIEFVTCKTRIAGLPYMVSICWPAEGS